MVLEDAGLIELRMQVMNILSSNFRGCGPSDTVNEICSLVKMHRPLLVFLSETKLSATRSQDLKWRLGFDSAFGVKSERTTGILIQMLP
jgi:hypothetical protein